MIKAYDTPMHEQSAMVFILVCFSACPYRATSLTNLKSSAYATRGSRIRRTKESEKQIVKITLMTDLSTTPKLTSLIRDKWIPTRTHCIRSDRKLENHINVLPAVIPLAFSAETTL